MLSLQLQHQNSLAHLFHLFTKRLLVQTFPSEFFFSDTWPLTVTKEKVNLTVKYAWGFLNAISLFLQSGDPLASLVQCLVLFCIYECGGNIHSDLEPYAVCCMPK